MHVLFIIKCITINVPFDENSDLQCLDIYICRFFIINKQSKFFVIDVINVIYIFYTCFYAYNTNE